MCSTHTESRQAPTEPRRRATGDSHAGEAPLASVAVHGRPRLAPDARDRCKTEPMAVGGRGGPAHRLDHLCAKRPLFSRMAIFSYRSSLSIVISPTLTFRQAISSSRSSRSRSFRAGQGSGHDPIQLSRQPGHGNVQLPRHRLQALHAWHVSPRRPCSTPKSAAAR